MQKSCNNCEHFNGYIGYGSFIAQLIHCQYCSIPDNRSTHKDNWKPIELKRNLRRV